MNQELLVCKPEGWLTLEQAALRGSVLTRCEWCGASVWVVPRNLTLRQTRGAIVVCVACGRKEVSRQIAEGTDPDIRPASSAFENKRGC